MFATHLFLQAAVDPKDEERASDPWKTAIPFQPLRRILGLYISLELEIARPTDEKPLLASFDNPRNFNLGTLMTVVSVTRRAFDRIDARPPDGTFDKSETKEWLKSIDASGGLLGGTIAKEFVKAFDSSGDGKVTFDEFQASLPALLRDLIGDKPIPPGEVDRKFDEFDRDGDNVVTIPNAYDTILPILTARGESLAEKKADIASKVVVDLVAADRRGITREDFRRTVQELQPPPPGSRRTTDFFSVVQRQLTPAAEAAMD